MSERPINYPTYDAIHEETDFTREHSMHPPKIDQKHDFMVIPNAWTWIPMQTIFYELEMCLQRFYVSTSQM